MEQKSFEQILAEKMAQPVSVKGKEGASVMPMEAMVLAVMNDGWQHSRGARLEKATAEIFNIKEL